MEQDINERIYEEFYPKVTRYLHGHLNNHHDAEDLIQTVFLKIYTHIDSFDETKSSLSTWIFNITRNTLIDHQRSMSLRHSEELTELYEDGESGVLDDLIMEESLDQLADALERLSDEERHVILMHYYHKHTMLRIAELMQRPYGQIKRIHAKALQKLRLYLEPSRF